MFSGFGNLPTQKSSQKGGPLRTEPAFASAASSRTQERGPTFSKVFRWRLPDGQTAEPAAVGIAGTFTHWQEVPLTRDSVLDAWHVTIHHIPGNRTHHYMLVVDGKPAHDKHCDGLAVPHGPQEERYQIMTARGPRVFMLFAQAK